MKLKEKLRPRSHTAPAAPEQGEKKGRFAAWRQRRKSAKQAPNVQPEQNEGEAQLSQVTEPQAAPTPNNEQYVQFSAANQSTSSSEAQNLDDTPSVRAVAASSKKTVTFREENSVIGINPTPVSEPSKRRATEVATLHRPRKEVEEEVDLEKNRLQAELVQARARIRELEEVHNTQAALFKEREAVLTIKNNNLQEELDKLNKLQQEASTKIYNLANAGKEWKAEAEKYQAENQQLRAQIEELQKTAQAKEKPALPPRQPGSHVAALSSKFSTPNESALRPKTAIFPKLQKLPAPPPKNTPAPREHYVKFATPKAQNLSFSAGKL
jgi:hypothetical protein